MNKVEQKQKTHPNDISKWLISIPWETRSAVTRAAERDGMSLNEWINKAFLRVLGQPIIIHVDNDEVNDRNIAMVRENLNHPWWKKIISQ